MYHVLFLKVTLKIHTCIDRRKARYLSIRKWANRRNPGLKTWISLLTCA